MVLASLRVVILGSASFLLFWVLAVFPSFKALPLGRTAGAVAGAVLNVALGVVSPARAYEAVDLSILGLLFGTMIVSVYLQQADMFKYLGHILSWRSLGGRDLLCRTCLLGALSGALFTNDTCCLVLTPFILRLCTRKGLPPLPFLVALATSANIGSAATPIGNPQNLVIAALSTIPFSTFVLGLLPSVLLGVALNALLLLAFYWRRLDSPADRRCYGPGPMDVKPSGSGSGGGGGGGPTATKNAAPWTPFQSSENLGIPHDLLHSGKSPRREAIIINGNDPAAAAAAAHLHDDVADSPRRRLLSEGSYAAAYSEGRDWKRIAWKCAVYLVACAMLTAFLLGYDLSWTSLTAGVCLMALDFCDAGPNLEKVSYPLLVFFTGMFITLDGFNSTGIPDTTWDIMEPHARIDDSSGIIVLTLVVILMSNIASNVPTVLILGARVAASALESNVSATKAWLFLAWTSTVAGNLTLIGSAANLIVSEQALKAQSYSYDLTFLSHLKFGFPSTLIVVAVGLPFITR